MSVEAISKEIGETVEYQVLDIPAVDLSARDVPYVDAVATDIIDLTDLGDGFTGELPKDADIEIKSAAYRISNGGSTCRGRFYLKKKAHQWLIDHDGYYLFIVHDFSRSLSMLAGKVVKASDINPTWSDVDGRRSEGKVAKISWGTVIEPETVAGPGGDEA